MGGREEWRHEFSLFNFLFLWEGLALLEASDYWGYNQHCVTAKSDARDVGQVLGYLRGPL